MHNPPPKILIAEDDPHLGFLLTDYLTAEGFKVNLCVDGELALSDFNASHYDLCLLDVMMPKLDGFSLAKEIRAKNGKVPILFITARSLKSDKLKGYGLGADDYIIKPFDEEELLCKIKAVLKRIPQASNKQKEQVVLVGKYVFDVSKQSLEINGAIKRMTKKECSILYYLQEHRNKVIKREDLLCELWGENDYFYGRSLDVFFTKLRKYLKDDPELSIENIFGVGFIFNVPAPSFQKGN